MPVEPAALADLAVQRGCRVLVATYNEPFVAAEWVREVFRCGRTRGLACGVVSNGYASPYSLAYLAPVTDAIKIDLKAMDDRVYRCLGGKLSVVTECIRRAHALGMWLEVVSLIVPGVNDDSDQLTRMAAFVAGVSLDIPWHVTAFHPDYTMTDTPPTPLATLRRATMLGRAAGLRHVYCSSVFGSGNADDGTRCHGCGRALIVRSGYAITANVMRGRACPDCGTAAPGIWEGDPPRTRPAPVASTPLKSC
jgi:pyruvate formate lyase activating enzyme